jgi:diacylglycerol kinase (ATP)
LKTCIIFNPTARGDKARRFRKHLDSLAAQAALKPTLAAGNARALAAEAVGEGFDLIVAAGGDGTVNEVLNGIGDVPDAFARVRLGVLPLGTVNVLALELGIPPNLSAACELLHSGRERIVDLPQIQFAGNTSPRLFTQMAGIGWDARAVELVDWSLKKKIGKFAYVAAGLRAMRERLPMITVSDGAQSLSGQLIIIGNGRFYGGRWALCPQAAWDDGLLEVTVFQRSTFGALLRGASAILLNRLHTLGGVQFLRAPELTLSSASPAPVQVDGEYAGTTPARCSLRPRTLRLWVPS